MPLHTDHRPTDLDQIIGNQDTVMTLKAHLAKDRPNRSLLFIGPSGCGKTTLATCVANELGAIDKNGWNFKVLNASDFRGIDTVRDVRAASQNRPLGQARARVWLWDECHKISSDGQEAMLKLLEDPPRDCWFLLATTNPEKLKATLKRRCTEFQVKPVSDRELSILLYRTLKAEGKKVPKEILQQIIQDSLGSPGVALNILDKVIDLPEKQMASCAKQWAENRNQAVTLCRLINDARKSGNYSWKEITELIQTIDTDPDSTGYVMSEYFAKVALGGDEGAMAVVHLFNYTPMARLLSNIHTSLFAEGE